MSKYRTFSLLKEFLSALRTQIVSYSGIWTDSCCQLSLWDNDATQFPQGSPLLFIIPQDFKALGEYQDGGGIEMTVINGVIKFRIILINILDQVQSDTNVITSTDIALGMYELVDHLVGDIQMLDLCSATGSYLIEPFRLESIGKPDRDKERPEYVYCDVKFSCSINQQITGVV